MSKSKACKPFIVDEFEHKSGTRQLYAIVSADGTLLLRNMTIDGSSRPINLDVPAAQRLIQTLNRYISQSTKGK